MNEKKPEDKNHKIPSSGDSYVKKYNQRGNHPQKQSLRVDCILKIVNR